MTTIIYKIDRAVGCIIVVVGTVCLHLEKMQCWEGMRISVNFTFFLVWYVCLFFGAYITRLISTLVIEVFVPRLEGERSCIVRWALLYCQVSALVLLGEHSCIVRWALLYCQVSALVLLGEHSCIVRWALLYC